MRIYSMKRLLTIALFNVVSLMAADLTAVPVYNTLGSIRCGAMRRPLNRVQVWCFSGIAYTDATSLMNAIFPVSVTGNIFNAGDPQGDQMLWQFNLQPDGTITFQVTAASGLEGGVLTGILPFLTPSELADWDEIKTIWASVKPPQVYPLLVTCGNPTCATQWPFWLGKR